MTEGGDAFDREFEVIGELARVQRSESDKVIVARHVKHRLFGTDHVDIRIWEPRKGVLRRTKHGMMLRFDEWGTLGEQLGVLEGGRRE